MSWPYPGFQPQIVYITTTSSWRCLVRKVPDGPYRSLEGPSPPLHATPDAALAATVSLVADLLAARKDSLAVEVVRLLTAIPARLKPATIPDPEGGPNLRYWIALGDDGVTWTSPQPTPYEAVRIALNRVNGVNGV